MPTVIQRIVAAAFLAAAVTSPGAESQNAVVLNIEPSPEFPRNSEGSFVTLKSGRTLFCYAQFFGGAADESAARIVSITSDDGGRTWNTAPKTIAENKEGANVMSVSLLRLKSGRIALIYLRKNSWADCRPYVQFSDDEAESWSEPKLIVPAPGYFVLNNDRVIQHSSGRLIAPVAYHRSRNTDAHSSRGFDSRAIALWYFSDDEGATWQEASQWLALPVPATRTGLQEPGIVELSDGGLLSFFRTDQKVQFESRSNDRGKIWTLPAPGPLSSPTSPASIERVPGSSELLAVWNDHSGEFPVAEGKRTPLVVGISTDDGKTWGRRRMIEPDPDGWYCYTAIHFVDDRTVLLAYCAGDSKVGKLNRLRIRRIDLDWLRTK